MTVLESTLTSEAHPSEVFDIACYLMDAVSRGEITMDAAETALLQWNCDPVALDTAADGCARREVIELIHRASSDARRAA